MMSDWVSLNGATLEEEARTELSSLEQVARSIRGVRGQWAFWVRVCAERHAALVACYGSDAQGRVLAPLVQVDAGLRVYELVAEKVRLLEGLMEVMVKGAQATRQGRRRVARAGMKAAPEGAAPSGSVGAVPGIVAPAPVWLDTRGVMRRLGLSRATVYRLRRSGALPCVQVGRSVRYRVEEVERFMEGYRRRVRGAAGAGG
jgi:excisionase family DNA binding protein